MTTKYEYRLAYSSEEHMGIGVKIMLAAEDDLGQTVESALNEAVDKIRKAVHKASDLKNPDLIASRAQTRVDLLACFPADPYPTVGSVREIPNGYYSHDVAPWYVVHTPAGPIEIGWRKRVISIDWTETCIVRDADELFPDQSVTKIGRSIHAWGYAKAKEYLAVLMKAERGV